MSAVTPTPLHRSLGLTDAEFERIGELLERAPNDFELAVFSLLWSEHCGYKHSARLLKRLPSQGKRVLQGPGENAGVIDLGDGAAEVVVRGTEAQSVEERNRSRPHRHDVAQDPADAGGSPLEGLHGGRMVVGLDLEGDGLSLAQVDHTCVLARALQDA